MPLLTFVRRAGVSLGLAAAVSIAGCSSGGEDSTPVAAPVQDHLDTLIGDEPLDQLQIALDTLLSEQIAANLPSDAGGRVLGKLSDVLLELIDAPDELLEALLLSGTLLMDGEADPAVYQMLLTDTGQEMITHVQGAVFDLAGVLLDAAGSGAGDPVSSLAGELLALSDLLNNPAAVADLSTLLEPLAGAVAALELLDAADLAIPAQGQEAVDTALDLVTGSLGRVTELLAGLSDSDAPAQALLQPIEALLGGLLAAAPDLQTVVAGLPDRLGFDPVTATLGLVGTLTGLLNSEGVLDRVNGLISPLIALLGPLTGRLSPLLCGVLPLCDEG
ncbi:MAG: hypothetical protein ABF271_07800 [Abyssibacter sp.]|uniref:hypothetical protein n=1 Tax=Abyssibacter sp. TaxID=2320200 RepID=UPI003218ED61